MDKSVQEDRKADSGQDSVQLPTEVEIYIDCDGTVTFADLAADLVAIASTLNPDCVIACDITQSREGQAKQY